MAGTGYSAPRIALMTGGAPATHAMSATKRENGMDAPFVYVVRFWVHPDSSAKIFDWLDNKHGAEVVAQPGFRWLRRVKLEGKADDGWDAYMMIYGLESREALMRYFESPAPKQYAQERKPFEHHLRTDRAWGEIDSRIG